MRVQNWNEYVKGSTVPNWREKGLRVCSWGVSISRVGGSSLAFKKKPRDKCDFEIVQEILQRSD